MPAGIAAIAGWHCRADRHLHSEQTEKHAREYTESLDETTETVPSHGHVPFTIARLNTTVL